MDFRSPNEIIDDALRAALKSLFADLGDDIGIWDRLYPESRFPNGIDSMERPTLKNAILLVQRTLIKRGEGA